MVVDLAAPLVQLHKLALLHSAQLAHPSAGWEGTAGTGVLGSGGRCCAESCPASALTRCSAVAAQDTSACTPSRQAARRVVCVLLMRGVRAYRAATWSRAMVRLLPRCTLKSSSVCWSSCVKCPLFLFRACRQQAQLSAGGPAHLWACTAKVPCSLVAKVRVHRLQGPRISSFCCTDGARGPRQLAADSRPGSQRCLPAQRQHVCR